MGRCAQASRARTFIKIGERNSVMNAVDDLTQAPQNLILQQALQPAQPHTALVLLLPEGSRGDSGRQTLGARWRAYLDAHLGQEAGTVHDGGFVDSGWGGDGTRIMRLKNEFL
jgi:hypothetical protein